MPKSMTISRLAGHQLWAPTALTSRSAPTCPGRSKRTADLQDRQRRFSHHQRIGVESSSRHRRFSGLKHHFGGTTVADHRGGGCPLGPRPRRAHQLGQPDRIFVGGALRPLSVSIRQIPLADLRHPRKIAKTRCWCCRRRSPVASRLLPCPRAPGGRQAAGTVWTISPDTSPAGCGPSGRRTSSSAPCRIDRPGSGPVSSSRPLGNRTVIVLPQSFAPCASHARRTGAKPSASNSVAPGGASWRKEP